MKNGTSDAIAELELTQNTYLCAYVYIIILVIR